MKNKNIVSSGLLLLIIVLIVIAISYYLLKRDNVSNEPSVDESSEIQDKPKNPVSTQSKVKKISNYDEFNEYASKQTNTFFVLGRTGCHYCEMYLPVIDEVSSEYDIEIIYLDFSKFSEDDYQKVINSALTIPSKCTTSGEEAPLSYGFGTPLSLFVKEDKSYDCIRGYKNKESLVSQLKSIGYIE